MEGGQGFFKFQRWKLQNVRSAFFVAGFAFAFGPFVFALAFFFGAFFGLGAFGGSQGWQQHEPWLPGFLCRCAVSR